MRDIHLLAFRCFACERTVEQRVSGSKINEELQILVCSDAPAHRNHVSVAVFVGNLNSVGMRRKRRWRLGAYGKRKLRADKQKEKRGTQGFQDHDFYLEAS